MNSRGMRAGVTITYLNKVTIQYMSTVIKRVLLEKNMIQGEKIGSKSYKYII